MLTRLAVCVFALAACGDTEEHTEDAAVTMPDATSPTDSAMASSDAATPVDAATDAAMRGSTAPKPPPQAAALGFTKLVLDQGGDAGWSIDSTESGAPGFVWYLGGFDGIHGKTGDFSVVNGILNVTNTASGANGNYTLGTAQSAKNAQKYVGTGYGNGFYAEASISMGNAGKTGAGWPSFWGEPLEHFATGGVGDQWQGQKTGYERFVELDFMEFWGQSGTCTLPGNVAVSPCYTFANLSWYGNYPYPSPINNYPNNVATTPSGTDFTAFHTYGALVVPSSLNKGTGYTQAYFNDAVSTKKNTWSAYDATATPPPAGTQTLAAVDVQHYEIILGTGPSNPMQVAYVRVWQAP